MGIGLSRNLAILTDVLADKGIVHYSEGFSSIIDSVRFSRFHLTSSSLSPHIAWRVISVWPRSRPKETQLSLGPSFTVEDMCYAPVQVPKTV